MLTVEAGYDERHSKRADSSIMMLRETNMERNSVHIRFIQSIEISKLEVIERKSDKTLNTVRSGQCCGYGYGNG